MIDQAKKLAIDRWCETIRDVSEPYGRFRFARCAVRPHSLEGSALVAQILHMLGTLDNRTEDQHKEWADYFLSCQDSATGFFIDPVIRKEDKLDSEVHTWDHFNRHQTSNVARGLAVLGSAPRFPIAEVDWVGDPGRVIAYLESLPWGSEPWGGSGSKVGNAAGLYRLNLASRGQDSEADAGLVAIFEWLEEHQDPATGLWGTDMGADHLRAMCGAFCLAHGTYLYYNRPYPRIEKMVDTVLQLVQRDQAFCSGNTNGCVEWDALVLLRLGYFNCNHRHDDIRAFARTRESLGERFGKPDGGYSFNPGGSLVRHNSMHVTDGQYQSDVLGTKMFLHSELIVEEILTDKDHGKELSAVQL